MNKDSLSYSEYTRLITWMKNPLRKPAHIEFTASACRDAGRAFEVYLESVPVINLNGKWFNGKGKEFKW